MSSEDQAFLGGGNSSSSSGQGTARENPETGTGQETQLPGEQDVLPDKFKYSAEEYAQAVQEKVEEAVQLQAKYRHAGLYTLFVIAYLVVLYLQASAYKSGDVVRTLKEVMMPRDDDGNLLSKATFKDQNAVLGHLWNNILEPTWKDPVCGDQKCEYPWEFPAYGRFGCKADCGMQQNLTRILVVVQHDFTGHPTANPRVLMAAAKWNMCLRDESRRARGEADLCWFENDQGFTTVAGNRLETADIIDGTWYIKVTGDYSGRISGAIYDLKNTSNPEPISLSPAWEKCEFAQPTRRSFADDSGFARRMMTEWAEKREDSRRRLREGEISQEEADAVDTEMIETLRGKVEEMQQKAKELEAMQARMKKVVARLKARTPAQKRLEERYGIDPIPADLQAPAKGNPERQSTRVPSA
uniref:Polycystin cation channel family n=3 Tax=Tetraselmis sp. GSL018 TaxID=582737 RepID=A0A061REY9_9CHLO|mmetsp:Transcript_34843/g.82659  ORF Transcript_34843/g.82659 Transcript_34843/m.82659 type:complete len:413 (-) Transcript_34843:251-1489(-)|eukprot:CAMPEP_0177584512 /NCGR_PEP_ID=MMETSP0419_2-20121207/3938_1 /TAXON_ID=582737 /ORGANISM="Tetraselmis sp., Strain GSL018" /LENGTH=412 /DNA_ID=CAMNT_0019074061 /DNA_START=519 /DNA_END=1757 /DNA_ORIENTATION=+